MESKPTSLSKEKLVEMLYLLMRDAAPTSEILRVVNMVAELQSDSEEGLVVYTSPELEAYARRMADKLLA